MAKDKRQVFSIVLPDNGSQGWDIEFIDPLAFEKDFKAKGGTVDAKSQYNNMQMLYVNPHAAKNNEERKKDPNRGYQPGVLKYASVDNRIEVPKDKKKDAQWILRVMQNRTDGKAYLNDRDCLSFDEVPDEEPAKK